MYDVTLWKYYSVTAFSKFKAAYNNCIKKLFSYARRDSMSRILLDLGLPTADTIVHNARVVFVNHCLLSCNQIIQWFADIALWLFYFLCFFLECFSFYGLRSEINGLIYLLMSFSVYSLSFLQGYEFCLSYNLIA